VSSIKVFAPASIGNIGIGFDIMGLALEKPGDEVIARMSNKPGLRITTISGDEGKLPYEVARNTAGLAALRLLEHIGETGQGIELEIHKKMPFSSGLGSSAASAVGGVFAVSELLQTGLPKTALLHFALLGEHLASGGFHADNVAPSLLGGIVLIRDNASLDVQTLPVPEHLYATVVYPEVEILTKDARAILKPEISLQLYVRQSANIAAFVTGLFRNDYALIGRSLHDVVIEPQRADLIPGFYAVKEAALNAGVLGCSISGSGPSVFALSDNKSVAEYAGLAMQQAFARHQITSAIFVSPVNKEGVKAIG